MNCNSPLRVPLSSFHVPLYTGRIEFRSQTVSSLRALRHGKGKDGNGIEGRVYFNNFVSKYFLNFPNLALRIFRFSMRRFIST
ncbi:MAG: hypothetical protein RLZZ205_915 [Bacteroidota bacterium]